LPSALWQKNMLEKRQGRWSLLDGYELLASSEARGAQETNCRSPQGTGHGEFFQAGADGEKVISAYSNMRKSVNLAET
jgi:hypothetical protein